METTTQIYLEITPEGGNPVKGESQAGGYENRIDIESFSFSAKAKKESLKDARQGTVNNNLDFSTVSVSKVFDRASLQLATLMNQRDERKERKRLKEARISVDQQYINPDWEGKLRNEILILELYGAYIADIKLRTSEGSGGAQIKEDITISFHNFRVVYYAEDRDKKGLIQDDYRTEQHIYESSHDEQEMA